ncbi:hypothetical protein [Cognatiyoonia sp. IB215182]|uniref:hypothetical protein n=1 Tax=Cognatiyoonia sp. IB215182 TaxID=3097353 RepID=UPI002A136691|nr:hypothetical protein [Cognatiyoonia sp. IB215182]MDX8352234.1 hypothetical protein [Cognatiyoonia sp. IB215182]
MADMQASVVGFQDQLAKPSSFSVEDTFWGYIVRSGKGPSLGVAIAQAVSFFFGVCLLTAAAGILILPALFFDGGIGTMRLGAAAMFGGFAAYLLWFASRGTQAEVHVDTSVGELREVICNRAGKPTTVGSYGFDTISGVHLDTDEASNKAVLSLRYRNTSQSVMVAEGTEAQLVGLRDRLASDLMVTPTTTEHAA